MREISMELYIVLTSILSESPRRLLQPCKPFTINHFFSPFDEVLSRITRCKKTYRSNLTLGAKWMLLECYYLNVPVTFVVLFFYYLPQAFTIFQTIENQNKSTKNFGFLITSLCMKSFDKCNVLYSLRALTY